MISALLATGIGFSDLSVARGSGERTHESGRFPKARPNGAPVTTRYRRRTDPSRLDAVRQEPRGSVGENLTFVDDAKQVQRRVDGGVANRQIAGQQVSGNIKRKAFPELCLVETYRSGRGRCMNTRQGIPVVG